MTIRQASVFTQLEEIASFPHDSITLLGLQLIDPDMPFDQWEGVGRILGHMHRLSAWMIGDWILYGERVYGEEAAQATEGLHADRYNVAERVTGLAVKTLYNYASTCSKIAIDVRRVELPFRSHQPVTHLEREQQIYWLQQAVENAWSAEDLRDAITGKVIDEAPSEDDGIIEGGVTDINDDTMTVSERIEQAARLVWRQATWNVEAAGWIVSPETMNQLAGALGED
jgi:hypothetical protein